MLVEATTSSPLWKLEVGKEVWADWKRKWQPTRVLNHFGQIKDYNGQRHSCLSFPSVRSGGDKERYAAVEPLRQGEKEFLVLKLWLRQGIDISNA